jgi:hypothetical protein
MRESMGGINQKQKFGWLLTATTCVIDSYIPRQKMILER